MIGKRKEWIVLSAKGYIQVRVYTSKAQIPLENAAVMITAKDGSTIAMRVTNQSGMLNTPIAIDVPDLSAGQTPGTGLIPFSVVDLYVWAQNYEAIEIKNLQIFPTITTSQPLEMIPLSEFPDSYNKLEIFDTPRQNL